MTFPTKLPERRWLPLLAAAALALPAAAQVVPPPEQKPPQTPAFTPPPPVNRTPPAPRTAAPRPAPAPDVPFDPITRRDADGRIIIVSEPTEYVAMGHNPLIDLNALAKMGPAIKDRRARMEAAVLSNLDLLAEVENGFIERIRTADEDNFRPATMRLVPLLMAVGGSGTLTSELVKDGAMLPSVGALTQKIMAEHNEDLTREAKEVALQQGETDDDRVLHVTLTTSLTEITYYYRRLLLEAADAMPAILPELGLSESVAASVKPTVNALKSESDLERRAELIREVFSHLDAQTRQKALRLVIDRRPDVDPAQLLEVPAGAVAKELDDETRLAIIMSLVDGVEIDTRDLLD